MDPTVFIYFLGFIVTMIGLIYTEIQKDYEFGWLEAGWIVIGAIIWPAYVVIAVPYFITKLIKSFVNRTKG